MRVRRRQYELCAKIFDNICRQTRGKANVCADEKGTGWGGGRVKQASATSGGERRARGKSIKRTLFSHLSNDGRAAVPGEKESLRNSVRPSSARMIFY